VSSVLSNALTHLGHDFWRGHDGAAVAEAASLEFVAASARARVVPTGLCHAG
jgi:hypothetical protein